MKSCVTNVSGTTCFETDIPEGGSGRRPSASVVSSASMSVLPSSSLRDYTPASRSENQDSLQVAFVGSLLTPAFAFSVWPAFLFSLSASLFLSSILTPLFPRCATGKESYISGLSQRNLFPL